VTLPDNSEWGQKKIAVPVEPPKKLDVSGPGYSGGGT